MSVHRDWNNKTTRATTFWDYFAPLYDFLSLFLSSSFPFCRNSEGRLVRREFDVANRQFIRIRNVRTSLTLRISTKLQQIVVRFFLDRIYGRETREILVNERRWTRVWLIILRGWMDQWMDVWMVARSWNEEQQNAFNERLFIMLLLWSLVIQVTMLLNEWK